MPEGDEPPGSLRELVNHALDHHGVRYLRDLERIAERDNLPKISHSTLAEIRKGTYRSRPSEKTLVTLAALAGVSYAVARSAADLPPIGPRFREDVDSVEGVDLLLPAERQALIGLMRVMVGARMETIRLESAEADGAGEVYGIAVGDLSVPGEDGNDDDTGESPA